MSTTIISQRTTHSYEPGDIILSPGPAQHLFRLHTGLVRIHSMDEFAQGLTLRYIRPGDFFGEETLKQLPRSYFAEAVTACTVETVDPATLDLTATRELAQQLAGVTAGLYRSTIRLATKPLRARIAAELRELMDSTLAFTDDDHRRTIRITHDELALSIGSVRETVTKAIGELVRVGAVNAGYGKVVVRDPELLQQLADG